MQNEFLGKKIKPLLSKIFSQRNADQPQQEKDPERIPLEHRAINGEFIREMFVVVLEREVSGEDEFLRYMNILDQGGHYEGIYNGIIYSAEYREKEKGNASVFTLKNFSEIMAQLTLDQRYDSNTEIPKPEEKKELVSYFEREGITKSRYFLKRRLGEELLKTIDLKKEYREKLATWYGKLTVFLNSKGIDFGIPQRNVKTEYYHYKWALEADEDRLKWECLNRIHRILNKS